MVEKIAAFEHAPMTRATLERVFTLCFFFFQAEDGIRDYKVTGVQTCALPISSGPGVRWDGGVEAGNEVTLFYDSLLAKLIVWGDTRATALQRMRRALRELVIVGLPSSQSFHLRVMADPEFQRGDVDVTYFERVGQRLLAAELAPELAQPLAIAAALLAEQQRTAAAPPASAAAAPDGPSPWLLVARRESIGGGGRGARSPPSPPGGAAGGPLPAAPPRSVPAPRPASASRSPPACRPPST